MSNEHRSSKCLDAFMIYFEAQRSPGWYAELEPIRHNGLLECLGIHHELFLTN